MPGADGHSQPMGTRAANIVLTSAILQTALEEVEPMSEKQFQAEKLYYISISIAKSMLEKGIIDKEVMFVSIMTLMPVTPFSGTP